MAATAVRVVGKPITHGTRTQRAEAALCQDGKQALQLVNQSKKAAATGKAKASSTVSTTFGRVYNATGDPITFVTAYDWEGRVAGKYPCNIQNGQWAVFEHVGTRGPQRQGSIAALVYNIEGCCEAMISWNNRWKTSHTAYCEMNEPGYFQNSCDWDEIYGNLMSSGTESQSEMEGYATKVSIDEGGNTPSYSATFYLDV